MTKRKSVLSDLEGLANKLTAPPDPTFKLPALVEFRSGVYSDSATGETIGDERAYRAWLAQQDTGPIVPGWLAVVVELTDPQNGPEPNIS